MDLVHFISEGGPLCGRKDALWCTILREAVTCPRCRTRLACADPAELSARGGEAAAGAPR